MNLSDAIAAFIADRKARGIAHGTVRNEKYVLNLLLADVGNIQTKQLRHQHLDVFWSRRTTWGPGTMNRARYSLNAFFSWCRTRGYIPRDLDLLAGTKKLKVRPRDRVTIPQAEFETFLDNITNPRTRVVIALGLYMFLRISEIEMLRWQDIRLDDGVMDVFRTKTTTVDANMPICTELDRELRRWKLAYAAQMGQPPLPGWYVVPGLPQIGSGEAKKGHKGFVRSLALQYLPERRSNLGYLMRRTLQEAGYYQPLEGVHTLRRSGAIALYNQLSSVGHDRSIRICQAMLGHSSVQTTEIYLRLDLDKKARNDVLRGRSMFPVKQQARVIRLAEGGG